MDCHCEPRNVAIYSNYPTEAIFSNWKDCFAREIKANTHDQWHAMTAFY